MKSYTAVTVRNGKWSGNTCTIGAENFNEAFTRLTYELSKNSSRRQALLHWDSQGCPVVVNRNTEEVVYFKPKAEVSK